MPEERTFSPSVPDGHVVYDDSLDIAGVQHHKPEAMRFLEGTRPFLEFEREPNNEYDPNAIKVLGTSTTAGSRRRYHLGYVERSVAAAIANSGAWGKVSPQIVSTFLGETGFVGIRYRIVGEADRRAAYHAQFGEEVRGVVGGESLTVTLKGQPKARFETGPLAGEDRAAHKGTSCLKTVAIGAAVVFGLGLLGTCLPDAGAQGPTRVFVPALWRGRIPTATPTQPAPTATATIAAPTPTTPAPTPTQAGPLSVLSYRAFEVYNYLYVVGEVRNNTGEPQRFVKIVATLYDQGGTFVGSDYTYTYLDVVPAGDASPFQLMFDTYAGATRVEFQGESRAGTLGRQDLAISGDVASMQYNTLRIDGQVTNTGGTPAEFVKIICTLYDAAGKVVDVDYTYSTLDVVPAGGSSPFTLYLSHPENWHHYRLQVQGR